MQSHPNSGVIQVTRLPYFAMATILVATAWTVSANDSTAGEPEKEDAAVKRARREVHMLDDIYKTGIVAITDNYVNDDEMIPAGTAFKQVFAAAEKNGWHKVRLVDATGDPIEEENSPEDDFEKMAVKKLVGGANWVESIETRQGTRHLRVATPISVVFSKCVMCHSNYEDVPKGQAIGALTYTVPINGPLVLEHKKSKQ